MILQEKKFPTWCEKKIIKKVRKKKPSRFFKESLSLSLLISIIIEKKKNITKKNFTYMKHKKTLVTSQENKKNNRSKKIDIVYVYPPEKRRYTKSVIQNHCAILI